MRNWMLLVLGVTACGKASAVPADVKETKEVVVTDAERQRMVESVTAWVKWNAEAWERGDIAALMETYLPGDSLVSMTQGKLYAARNSVEHMLDGISTDSDRHTEWQIYKIDVLAPDVAALALSFSYQGKHADKKPFDTRGVYTAVLAEKGGHLRIVQEHQSMPCTSRVQS